jgi:hypothetical protein
VASIQCCVGIEMLNKMVAVGQKLEVFWMTACSCAAGSNTNGLSILSVGCLDLVYCKCLVQGTVLPSEVLASEC